MIRRLLGGDMSACPRGWIVLAALALSPPVAAAQSAPACAPAATPADQAICANSGLEAADAAMEKAYAALRAALPPAQQEDLRRDQREWVKDRDGGCLDKKGAALVACLMRATEKRRHFLAGEGGNGAAGATALLPVFLYETQPERYEIAIAYPQFAAKVAPGFNAAVKDAIFGKDALEEYRGPSAIPDTDAANFYDVQYETTYLSPRLVSVTLQFGGFAGGAHPNNWRIALLWDPTADKPVALSDFLADPATAVPAIAALCKAQGEKENWGLFDNPDFAAVVGEEGSWSVRKDGVTIEFDPYAVTPYVAGPHDCRLGYAELKPWLKPGGPLPPH